MDYTNLANKIKEMYNKASNNAGHVVRNGLTYLRVGCEVLDSVYKNLDDKGKFVLKGAVLFGLLAAYTGGKAVSHVQNKSAVETKVEKIVPLEKRLSDMGFVDLGNVDDIGGLKFADKYVSPRSFRPLINKVTEDIYALYIQCGKDTVRPLKEITLKKNKNPYLSCILGAPVEFQDKKPKKSKK